jgi:hypothetical protein
MIGFSLLFILPIGLFPFSAEQKDSCVLSKLQPLKFYDMVKNK